MEKLEELTPSKAVLRSIDLFNSPWVIDNQMVRPLFSHHLFLILFFLQDAQTYTRSYNIFFAEDPDALVVLKQTFSVVPTLVETANFNFSIDPLSLKLSLVVVRWPFQSSGISRYNMFTICY